MRQNFCPLHRTHAQYRILGKNVLKRKINKSFQTLLSSQDLERTGWPGIEPRPPVWQAGILNHYTISPFPSRSTTQQSSQFNNVYYFLVIKFNNIYYLVRCYHSCLHREYIAMLVWFYCYRNLARCCGWLLSSTSNDTIYAWTYDDQECFKWSFLAVLHPASENA